MGTLCNYSRDNHYIISRVVRIVQRMRAALLLQKETTVCTWQVMCPVNVLVTSRNNSIFIVNLQ
jgi:hypothetical protein